MGLIESLVFGYAVLSYLLMGAALLGGASPGPVFLAVGVVGLLLAAAGWRNRHGLGRTFLAWRPWLWLLLLLAPVALLVLVPVYARDDTIYHMVVPRLTALAGRLPLDPYNVNSNFPKLFEMPLVVSELSGGALSPFLVNLCFLVALAMAFARFAARHFDVPRGGGLALGVVLALTPALVHQVSSAYVEVFFTLLVLLSFHHLLVVVETQSRTHWLLAMVCAGLACATKYLGLLYFGYIAAVGFLTLHSRRSLYTGVALGLVVAAPWYVRNWIALGNPCYPLLNSVFESPWLSPERSFQFNRLLENYHDGRGIIDTALLPLKVVFGWSPTPVVGRLGFGGSLSLFFVLPLLALAGRTRKAYVVSAAFLAYVLFWATSSQQVRFLVPAAVPAAAAGAGLMRWLWEQRRRTVFVLGGVLVCQLVYLNVRQIRHEWLDVLLLGRLSRDAFLSHHMPASYGMAKHVNEVLDPARHKMLTVGNFGRNYYFTIPVLTNTYYDTEWFDKSFAWGGGGPAVLDSTLDRLGVTHLLFSWDYYRMLHPTPELVNVPALESYLARSCRPVLRQGGVVLLERNTEAGVDP